MSKVKYIQHYDEELKKTFEIPEYDFEGLDTFEDFVKADPALFNAAVLSAVFNGVTMDLPTVPVFVIKGTDKCFSIIKEDYAEKLDICLTFFEGLEEYEICKTLIELKDKL